MSNAEQEMLFNDEPLKKEAPASAKATANKPMKKKKSEPAEPEATAAELLEEPAESKVLSAKPDHAPLETEHGPLRQLVDFNFLPTLLRQPVSSASLLLTPRDISNFCHSASVDKCHPAILAAARLAASQVYNLPYFLQLACL